MTKDKSPAYLVDGRHRFYNRWQALSYAHRSGSKDVRFDLWDSVFAEQEWRQNPMLSWTELCDIRARQLEAKHRPIVILWSGGTDSYTMYQVLARNGVKVSAFVIKTRSDETRDTDSVGWLKTNHQDASTQYIFVDNDDVMRDNYDTPYYVIEKPNVQSYSLATPDRHMLELIYSRFHDPLILGGWEKPRVWLEQGNWYSTNIDFLFEACMPPNQIEFFYITPDLPELHVKQCWMLKTWLESSGLPLTEKFVNQDLYDARCFDYHTYAYACGRLGDLSRSDLQKIGNANTKLIIDTNDLVKSRVVGRGSQLFHSRLESGDVSALNYLKGRRSLREPGFIDRFWIHDDGSHKGIITTKFFMGKHQERNNNV